MEKGNGDENSNNIVSNALTQYLQSSESSAPTVSVPAKNMAPKNVIIPSMKATIIAWAVIIVIPVLVLLAGIIVWAVRRKK